MCSTSREWTRLLSRMNSVSISETPTLLQTLRTRLKTAAASVRWCEESNENALPADADEPTRQNLAEKYAPFLVRTLRDYPWMDNDAMAHVSKKSVTRQMFEDALRVLHNETQVDVIHRAKAMAREQLRREG